MNLRDKIKELRHAAAFPKPSPQEFVGCRWAEAVDHGCCGGRVRCGNPLRLRPGNKSTLESLRYCQKHCKPPFKEPPGGTADSGQPPAGGKNIAGDASPRKEAPVLMGTHTPEEAPASPAIGPIGPIRPIRIVGVFTAFNEGDEVRKTVESWLGSIKEAEALAIVVDDGSSDGSCDGLDRTDKSNRAYTLRHETPQGVGRSRNEGAAAPLAWGADVVTFHDAHMRFPDGVIEALARKAIETGAIVCSKAKGWWFGPDHPEVRAGKRKAGEEHGFRAWGADLHWNLKDGLQPKYRIYEDKSNRTYGTYSTYEQVPCPMGACYVMSRATIEKLMAPTGRLWEDVAGRWGFSEQALAVKAFLLGIPILVSRDLATHHLYRSVNPVPNAGAEVWRNVTFSMAALLSPETFDLRFRDYCAAHLGPKMVDSLVAEADPPQADRTDTTYPPDGRRASKRPRHTDGGQAWMAEDEGRIFTHLLGRGATVTEPHKDHAWLEELQAATRHTDGGQVGRIGPIGHILQWRPGESTVLLRKAFPQAEITALEWCRHQVQNWQPVLKRLGVNLIQTDPPMADWVNPPYFRRASPVRFDLITIGGEFPDECRKAAEDLLAPGGQIIVNPSADTYQIEDAERRKADEQLKAWKQRPDPQITQITQRSQGQGEEKAARSPNPEAAVSSSAESAQSADSVTVVLLNWRRPENIGPILDCLAHQTVRPRVMIWDNGAAESGPLQFNSPNGELRPIEEHPLVSLCVRPSRNLGCMARWWLASQAQTEFVAVLDDDLVLADERVLEDAIAAQRALCPDGIVGFFGVVYRSNKSYRSSPHLAARSGQDQRVDIVKGRFMVLRRDALRRVPLWHPALTPEAAMRADDIYVSLMLGAHGGAPLHVLPGILAGRWKELGRQDGRALASDPGHYEIRDKVMRALLADSDRSYRSNRTYEELAK